jgi:transcriptional regulator
VTIYLPRAFDERDLAHLDALAADHPLASLISVIDHEPFVSQAPLLYSRRGNAVELVGHLARANPQAGRRGRVLALYSGPQAYVSPTWYPDKREQARVPTWNYVVAHLSGEIEPFDDEESLAGVVERLSALHESRVGGGWRFDPDNAAERAQLRGIVGFRIAVDRIELKAKLSQNHPAANRGAVIARLEAAGTDDGRGVARWMRSVAPTSTQGA